jgi:hypothetical protein
MPTSGTKTLASRDCSSTYRWRLPAALAATAPRADLRTPPQAETVSPAAFSLKTPCCNTFCAACTLLQYLAIRVLQPRMFAFPYRQHCFYGIARECLSALVPRLLFERQRPIPRPPRTAELPRRFLFLLWCGYSRVHLRMNQATGLMSMAVTSHPRRIASSGIAPPPAKGSRTFGARPPYASRSFCRNHSKSGPDSLPQ